MQSLVRGGGGGGGLVGDCALYGAIHLSKLFRALPIYLIRRIGIKFTPSPMQVFKMKAGFVNVEIQAVVFQKNTSRFFEFKRRRDSYNIDSGARVQHHFKRLMACII